MAEYEDDLNMLEYWNVEDYLDPTNDVLFKYLFARDEGKIRTIALLNALLENELQHRITDLTFLPTETIAESKDGKICRLDVYCLLDSGEYIDIEMQRLNERNIVRRSLDYWSTCYKEQLKSGQDYRELTPVICINILDFIYFKERKNFYHLASIHLENPDERLSNDLRLVFIELPKLKPHDNLSKMEKWLMFLDPRVPFSVKEKLAMNDVAMSSAVNSCKIFSSDSMQRLRYEFEEIAKRSQRSAISSAKMEGITVGRVKGRIEGGEEMLQKNAISLMQNEVSLDVINKALGISKEELLDLAKKHNIAVKV